MNSSSEITKISIAEIEDILRSIPTFAAVQIEDQQVLAKLKGKDRDKELAILLLDEVNAERLICNIPLAIPEDKYKESLLITNIWNRITDSQDTYAYVSFVADRLFIRIESYCVLMGNIDRKRIVAWLQHLIDHLHRFEEVMLSRLSCT